jgi:two-component sensor histidine kinase/ligand-binding sensor domain-containing protein
VKHLFAILCSAVLPCTGLATGPPARFVRLGVEQGLSQSTGQAITQDHAGFLWIGTEEGLNRYDGYSFVVYKHNPEDPESLPDDMISALCEDRQHHLWVGTESGLCRFDRRHERFYRVPVISARVTAVTEDADGVLWVATGGGGLYKRESAVSEFVSYVPDPRWTTSIAGFNISSLLCDHNGRLWVGCRDSGVDLIGKDGKTFFHHRFDPANSHSLGQGDVWGLAEDGSGRLWVALYGGGLSVLDQTTGHFRRYRHVENDPTSLPSDLVTCVFVDRANVLWVGSDGYGIWRYDPAADRFVALRHDAADLNSLSEDVVRTISEDSQQQIWIGTYLGGVNLLKRPRSAFTFHGLNAADLGSLSDLPSAFLEDAEGRIWIGTGHGWLNHFDREKGTFIRHRMPTVEPGGTAILAMHRDRRGRVWIGGYRSGLCRYEPATEKLTRFLHQDGNAATLGNDEVWALAEDRDGNLWVGTNRGVDRFDPERCVVTAHYDNTAAEEPISTRALICDGNGDVWIGSLMGLYRIRRGEKAFTRYRHDERSNHGLSNDRVMALHEDAQGHIWLGTLGGGLNDLDPSTGSFTTYARFPSNAIYAIQEDAAGRHWLSTNHGLSRFHPRSGHIDNFDLSNGLQSLQFRPGASLRTRAGRMLFASSDGMYEFDPESIKPDEYVPPVAITALRLFNEPAHLPETIVMATDVHLSYADKVFSFEFAALDYTFPRRNLYAYNMEGFSPQWIELGGKREVTFTNLDPGSYVFHVKASNSDGVWNDNAATDLRVIVHPPYWQTLWFRGLCSAAVLLTLFAAHRGRVRHLRADLAERKRAEASLRQAEERLIASLQEKDLLLKEIHHRVKNNLQVIASLLNLQAAQAKDPVVVNLLAESQNRVRSMALVHESLHQSKNLTRIALAPHIQSLCNQLGASYGTDRQNIRLSTQIADATLDLERAIPFGLIVTELVSNAIKHAFPESRAGNVAVELRVSESGEYALTVKDDGVGIPEHLSPGTQASLGLRLVNVLVEQLRGSLMVDRAGGTSFTVRFQTATNGEVIHDEGQNRHRRG